MSDADERAAYFKEAVSRAENTDRLIRRAAVFALVVVCAAAVSLMSWATVRFGNEIADLQAQQIHFHSDTTCQTAALDAVLTELAKAQQAQEHHQTPPVFVYPKPC